MTTAAAAKENHQRAAQRAADVDSVAGEKFHRFIYESGAGEGKSEVISRIPAYCR